MGFGFIACCRAKGLRAMLSCGLIATLRRAARKTIRSTAKPWCALCWLTDAANRGSAPWAGADARGRGPPPTLP